LQALALFEYPDAHVTTRELVAVVHVTATALGMAVHDEQAALAVAAQARDKNEPTGQVEVHAVPHAMQSCYFCTG
jgi:hypothetical protein